jgi:hypothetical protein
MVKSSVTLQSANVAITKPRERWSTKEHGCFVDALLMWHTQLGAFWFRTYLWISLNRVFLSLFSNEQEMELMAWICFPSFGCNDWKKVEEHVGTKTTNLISCYMRLGIQYLIQELKLRTNVCCREGAMPINTSSSSRSSGWLHVAMQR